MADLNYAKVYSDTLAQAFPYVLNFGALYATPNNGRYRFSGGKTIELPVISMSGRVASSRDEIGTYSRAYENTWETKTLSNQRKWSTLIHPQDIDQTDYAVSIGNITSTFNNEYKFPEMDAYTVSKIYADWIQLGNCSAYVTLSSQNIISTFDSLMEAMTEARVPATGRILYVVPEVMTILKGASDISRSFDLQKAGGEVNRMVTMLDGVQVVEVPAALMKTEYTFTTGWAASGEAEQIKMLLIHPESVITPVSYQFARLDEPSAVTGGKYVYYEESFEDVFILNNRDAGIKFVLDGIPVTGVTLSEATASVAVGADKTLSATVAPAGATENSVKWSSSDTDVATVDASGVVTGVAGGTAVITVMTVDGGKTATCTVTVTE